MRFGPMFVLAAPQTPVQIWRNVGVEGEGSEETWRIVTHPPVFMELPGRFGAITCKLVIKRLQEALQKTSGIDIPEADFTSGAAAGASLPLSCWLWNFTST